VFSKENSLDIVGCSPLSFSTYPKKVVAIPSTKSSEDLTNDSVQMHG